MWVDSKSAAEILGVKYMSLVQSTYRANKLSKKFCSIKHNILCFCYTDGNRGGAGGKTLQIWLDDEIVAKHQAKECENRLTISEQTNPNLKVNDENIRGLCSVDCSDGSCGALPGDSSDTRCDTRSCLDSSECIYASCSDDYLPSISDSKFIQESIDTRACKIDTPMPTPATQTAQNLIPKIKIKDLDNMNRVKAVAELRSCPKGMSKTIWGKSVAGKYAVSLKTLYEWAKILETDEVKEAQVVDDELGIDFKAKFKSSSFDMSALEWAVAAMINNPLASKTFIYEKLTDHAEKNALKIGSYKSFARLTDTPEIKALVLKAVNGDRGVRNEIAPFVLRDLNCYESLELVCGDQIVFDFNAVCPAGEVVNPNAYVWIDMGSGAIIGIDITFGKYNKFCIGNSLKMAVKFGVPDAIYTDNGKPELSKYITQVRSDLGGIKFKDFDDLPPTMLHKKARPRNSRAKPIENMFNHIQRRMGEMIMFENGGASYHKDNRKKDVIKEYAKANPLNFDKFIAYFEKAVKWWNDHVNKDRKIVPMDSFLQKLAAKPRAIFDETTLEYIFSERRIAKVKNSRINLTIKGERRTYSHPKLSKFIGEEVEVRIKQDEINSVNIVDIDKNLLICEAALINKIDPRDEEALKASIARNEAVVKAVREAFKYYDALYAKPNTINAHSSVAHQSKVKNEKNKKLNKKIALSNKDLLEAM